LCIGGKLTFRECHTKTVRAVHRLPSGAYEIASLSGASD
jgi:hypothetical protein